MYNKMTTIDIKEINGKRICMINSFCIFNLTDICGRCNINTGNTKHKNKFKTGDSLNNDEVINRIYA